MMKFTKDAENIIQLIMIISIFVGIGLALLLALVKKRIYKDNPEQREVMCLPRDMADNLLKANQGWRIAPEEDNNTLLSHVWLERPYKIG